MVPSRPRVLVTGPPGSGKSRLVLAAFDAVVEEAGPEAALLVLPTYGEVEHQKRLAVSRRSDRAHPRGILDAPYATFTSLGERLAEGFRVRALPSQRERDLLAEAALKKADVEAFRLVRDRPGFRARFLRLVKELKQTGEDPAVLRARLAGAAPALPEAPRERLEGVLRAWEAYEALLAAAGCPDHEDVLRDLARAVREHPEGLASVRLFVVDGFEDLTGVERAVFEAAVASVAGRGGRALVALPWDARRAALFASTRPLRDRLLGQGFVEHALTAFLRAPGGGIARLADRLFLPADGDRGDARGPLDPGGDLRAMAGADAADEADRIGREILRLVREEPGVVRGFRDMGIVLRRLDGKGPALRRSLEALGVPVRLVSGGERLSSEAVVRAVRGPLAVVAGADGRDDRDFDPLRIVDWLRWRALASGRPLLVDPVDGIEAAWREDGLPATWEGARSAVARASREAGEALDEVEALRREGEGLRGAGQAWPFLARVVEALLPLPGSAGLDADGRPLDPAADARTRRAHVARAALAGLAVEAGRAAARTGLHAETTLAEAVEDLLASAAAASAEPDDRRLDAVSVMDAEEARHWELPVVFVAGLVEREFPLHPREDVFLRDDDREALSARLEGHGGSPPWRTAHEAEEGERRLFLSAVTRAKARLYLSRSCLDDAGRERSPSFLWREVRAALGFGPDDEASFGRPPADLGRLHPPPDEAQSERDLLRAVAAPLGALARPEGEEARRRAVALARAGGAAVASLLARAERFWRPRADPLPPAALPRFAAATEILSPSRLTDGRVCLHRFFLRAVAGVPEDASPFGGPGFDRRVLGDLVHRALREAVREPDEPAGALAARVVDAEERCRPDPAAAAWARVELARIVALFREREAAVAACGFAPRPGDLEWRFADDGVRVVLGSGDGQFLLRGAVDRLDASAAPVGARQAIVVDYKTSPGTAEDAWKALLALEDLQLPLYARAVEAVRGVRVVGLELYAAARRQRFVVGSLTAGAALEARKEAGKAQVREEAEFRAVLEGAERLAAEVVAAARRGDHRKAPLDPDGCDKCPVRAVCRPDPARAEAAPAPEGAP